MKNDIDKKRHILKYELFSNTIRDIYILSNLERGRYDSKRQGSDTYCSQLSL